MATLLKVLTQPCRYQIGGGCCTSRRNSGDLRHVWDQLVEHAALPEQRMGPVFGRVDLEMAVHAEAFTSGAEQRQENDGEGVQEKKPVAPLRIGDAKNA